MTVHAAHHPNDLERAGAARVHRVRDSRGGVTRSPASGKPGDRPVEKLRPGTARFGNRPLVESRSIHHKRQRQPCRLLWGQLCTETEQKHRKAAWKLNDDDRIHAGTGAVPRIGGHQILPTSLRAIRVNRTGFVLEERARDRKGEVVQAKRPAIPGVDRSRTTRNSARGQNPRQQIAARKPLDCRRKTGLDATTMIRLQFLDGPAQRHCLRRRNGHELTATGTAARTAAHGPSRSRRLTFSDPGDHVRQGPKHRQQVKKRQGRIRDARREIDPLLADAQPQVEVVEIRHVLRI
jgi:hypothetical protein